MSFRILHLADLHLDTSFAGAGLPAQSAKRRRNDLRESFQRAVDYALANAVDAVTIGGDLYEHERSTPDTAAFVQKQLLRLAPIPVLISPGNHDPLQRGSLYSWGSWPNNVHVFDSSEFQPFELSGGPVVWGAAHDSPDLTRDITSAMPSGRNAGDVLLMHGTDMTRTLGPDKRAHCPFSRQRVAGTGIGLALLGHLHSFGMETTASTLFCYPGCVEPLASNDFGPHGAALAEFVNGAWQVEQIPLARWECSNTNLDISECSSASDVTDKLLGIWPAEADKSRLIVSVRLMGVVPESMDLDIGSIAEACQSYMPCLSIIDDTMPPYDYEQLRSEPTTKGKFVDNVLKQIEDASDNERTRLEKALIYGLRALEGRRVGTI